MRYQQMTETTRTENAIHLKDRCGYLEKLAGTLVHVIDYIPPEQTLRSVSLTNRVEAPGPRPGQPGRPD
jgi:hypothetical protein